MIMKLSPAHFHRVTAQYKLIYRLLLMLLATLYNKHGVVMFIPYRFGCPPSYVNMSNDH